MMPFDKNETEFDKITSVQDDSEAYKKIYGFKQDNSASIEKEFLEDFEKSGSTNKLKIVIPIIAVVLAVFVAVWFLGKSEVIPFSHTSTTTLKNTEEVTTDKSPSADPLSLTAHLFFDANGGTAEFTEKTACIGDTYNHLPNAARDGYLLEGWFTKKVGGEQITPDTAVKDTTETVFAHWKEITTTTAVATIVSTTSTTKVQTNPNNGNTMQSKVKRSNDVLFKNREMIIYSVEGFDAINMSILPEEEGVTYRSASTGVIGNDSYYSNLGCKEYVGDGGHTAAWFAVEDAKELSVSSYTRTVNGLTFSCVDYLNEYGWYGTVLYYVSDGHLIEISGTSGARDSIWPMLDACVFGL